MIIFILYKPQLGENIGLAARAMANFNIDQLRIVAPRDGWPNDDAIAASASALPYLEKKALIFPDLATAIADIDELNGLSARINRNIDIKTTNLSLYEFSDYQKKKNIAFLFGPENNGLGNEQLKLCDNIIFIDSNQEFPSMNLSHAVAVVSFYLRQKESSKGGLELDKNILPIKNTKANKGHMSYLLNEIDNILVESNFYPYGSEEKEKQSKIMKINLANRLNSFELTETEVNSILKMLKILKKNH